MILQICLIIIGAAFVILGADKLTEGAAALARKMKMSEMIIGLTIVAAGTSAPELFSSLVSDLKDKPDMAVGNVLGSNILNIFFILGVSATITPIALDGFSFVDYYVLLASSLLIYAVARFGGKAVITRFEGALLVAGYVAYTTWLVMNA